MSFRILALVVLSVSAAVLIAATLLTQGGGSSTALDQVGAADDSAAQTASPSSEPAEPPQEVFLTSTNLENSEFVLCVPVASEHIRKITFGDQLVRYRGRHRLSLLEPVWVPHLRRYMDMESPDSESHYTANLDIEGARQAAAALSVSIAVRTAPPCTYEANWRAAKTEFKLGENVEVELQLLNCGSRPFRVFGSDTECREQSPPNYFFQCIVRRGGEEVRRRDPWNDGGSEVGYSVAPNESQEMSFCVSRYYVFDEPGQYEVNVRYLLEFDVELEDSQIPANACPFVFSEWEARVEDSLSITVVP